MWDFARLLFEISIELNCFPSYFCFLVVLLILVLFVLFLVDVISLPLFFFMCLRVVLSMYRRYLQCRRVLFLFLFLTHTPSLCHLWYIRPYASSRVFLFSGPFEEFLLSSTLRIVLSILQEGQPLMRLLLYTFVSSSFLVLLKYSLKISRKYSFFSWHIRPLYVISSI